MTCDSVPALVACVTEADTDLAAHMVLFFLRNWVPGTLSPCCLRDATGGVRDPACVRVCGDSWAYRLSFIWLWTVKGFAVFGPLILEQQGYLLIQRRGVQIVC